MQVAPLYPGQRYRDRDGLERVHDGDRQTWAVLDDNGRVIAKRRQRFMADIAAAGCRQAAIAGIDWQPAP